MKTAIRLQNHGCTNHPYWWIVVAANRKNIKGRFLEHVGYWSPRQGVNVQRQIVLNIPRIKYWISCGAVPTFKVQKFLSLWNILPRPWFQQRTQEELDALKKPQAEWTDKDRIKEQRKRKRREREKMSPLNYYHRESSYKGAQTSQIHKITNKIREKVHAAERENQILRELLLHNEFHKNNRINQLAGHVVYDDSEELARLEGELAKAKAQLALLDRTFKDTTLLHKIKAIQDINRLVDKIREVQRERLPFRKRNNEPQVESQNTTQFQLDKKLEYELVTSKIQKMNQEMAYLDTLHEVVTLEEYANHLQSKDPTQDPAVTLQMAQQIFIERGRTAIRPLTKFDLFFETELQLDASWLPGDSFQITNTRRKRKIVDGKVVDSPYHQEKQRQRKEKEEAQALSEAQRREELEREGKTPLELKNLDQIKQHDQILKKIPEEHILKYILTRPDVIVPTNRPVHPFPDLNTYIPEEYYEPITTFNLKITPIASLQPKEELNKYHQKRSYSAQSASKKPQKKTVKKEASA